MLPVLGMFINVISALTGQLGPNYDQLFYDVMILHLWYNDDYGFPIINHSLLATCTWLGLQRQTVNAGVDELDRHFLKDVGIGLI